MSTDPGTIRLGVRENLGQFSLLVLINAFVGMMVGLERTVVPLIGEREFGLVSKTAIVSFIVSFGVTKAICNLFAARVSETVGRKKVLVTGWLIGLPVPFIIIFAHHWYWFNAANVLLGINQALCWSMHRRGVCRFAAFVLLCERDKAVRLAGSEASPQLSY